MLKRVEPLRNELQKLEDDAKDNQQKANEVEQMIRDLEASIARYKEEYAVLISEAQAIKADLAAVEAKVRLHVFSILSPLVVRNWSVLQNYAEKTELLPLCIWAICLIAGSHKAS